ncbi:MAG: cytochrome c-type biogenesis protein CcmH [Gemmatimonadetes bacterium]|nr:cytochrome c-type biogenesis protein CcmH [Gemmatimonadota bacterium]
MRGRPGRHPRLRALVALGGLIGVGSPLAAQAIEDPFTGEPPATQELGPEREAEIDALTAEIGATLRCPVCRQQSVAESPDRVARAMQGVIRRMLIEGKSPEEIEAYFVESYGPWILLQPKAEGASLWVYLGPALAFALGGGLFVARIRRGAGARDEADPAAPVDPDIASEDRAWLDSAIRDA